MTQNIRNNKAQFFIASAIIITAVVTLVFYYVTNIERIDSPSLISDDDSFFFTNIKNEYEQVADYALAVVSKDETLVPTADAYFSDALANFTEFVQNLSHQKGMSLDITHGVAEANNRTMNASINITLMSTNSKSIVKFNAVSSLNVSMDTSEIELQECDFNFTAREEYGKPILYLNFYAPNFRITFNNTVDACSYTELGNGKYTAECPSTGCATTFIQVNVTDFRNIRGHETYTT
jgi:hypothetical protein